MSDTSAPQFLDVMGHRVRYRVLGDGEPLLMIHGIGAPLEFWRPLEQRLDGCMTITVDPPGSGLSSVPRCYFPMRDFAAVFEHLLDRLGVDQAHVIGLSLGGMMAQEFAHRSRERVRTLILASTACGVGAVPAHPMRLAAMVSPLRFYSRHLYEKMASVFYGDGDQELLHEHLKIRNEIPTSVRGFYMQMVAAATWSSLPWLHALDLPALVIYGTADRAFPAINGKLLAGRLRQGRLEMVPGGSHMWLLQEPDRSARLIREFLEL